MPNESTTSKKPDKFGTHRVLSPLGVLPQQAQSLSVELPVQQNELLIRVSALNIDSSSFRQIKEYCSADSEKMGCYIQNIVAERGKMQNPVTGSGGMLVGHVQQIGTHYFDGATNSESIVVGSPVATLVSLSLTPLKIEKIKEIHLNLDRVDIEGYAVLFQSGVYAKLPPDIPQNLALAVLDVCGAPAHTRAMCKEGDTVVVLGGAGKSGLLCLYEAKKAVGPKGKVIGLDYDKMAVQHMKTFSFVDAAAVCDARDAISTYEIVRSLTPHGNLADIVINVTNVSDAEMSCVLSAKKGGVVYFFSTATNFNKAALGSEGIGADVTLVIGNGYKPGHAELGLNILRDSKEIRSYYEAKYGAS